jgi:hypothetical protein
MKHTIETTITYSYFCRISKFRLCVLSGSSFLLYFHSIYFSYDEHYLKNFIHCRIGGESSVINDTTRYVTARKLLYFVFNNLRYPCVCQKLRYSFRGLIFCQIAFSKYGVHWLVKMGFNLDFIVFPYDCRFLTIIWRGLVEGLWATAIAVCRWDLRRLHLLHDLR